jgi:hypothetical protein
MLVGSDRMRAEWSDLIKWENKTVRSMFRKIRSDLKREREESWLDLIGEGN